MNRLFLSIIFFCAWFTVSAQQINSVATDHKGNKKILGKLNKEGLTSAPFNEWFSKNYDAYEVDTKITKKLKRKLKKYHLTIFMGTWCGDSKKGVPRVLRILEAANFPMDQLEIVGLDNEKKFYKQSPTREEKGKNIHRVPTFILSTKKGKEIGRIVESPVESLEADLLKISRKKPYTPNYEVVEKMNALFTDKGLEYVSKNSSAILEKLKPLSKSPYELNTYGYVLLYAKELPKALAVFNLNSQLYPDNKRMFSSLGNAYYYSGDYEKATKNFKKVLSLDATDERAKTMLAKMKE